MSNSRTDKDDFGPLGALRRKLRQLDAIVEYASTAQISKDIAAILDAPEWEAAAMAGRATPESLAIESWLALFHAANAIHGAIDEQTYDEKRRADCDLPDSHEFSVTITADEDRALTKAIIGVEPQVMAARQQARASLGLCPTGKCKDPARDCFGSGCI